MTKKLLDMINNYASARCLAVTAGILLFQAPWAQESEYTPLAGNYDFLAVKNVTSQTLNVLEYGNLKPWEGDGMHAGIESFGLTLFTCKEVPDEFEVPANPAIVYEIKDLEGRSVFRQEADLSSFFKKLQFVSATSTGYSVSTSVYRGGRYRLAAEITPALYSYETEWTLVDEPNIQIFDTKTNVNSSVFPNVTFSSGYPYDPEDYTGQRHLHWQVAAADAPGTVIAEKDEVLDLKSDTPTLAAVASLRLETGNLAPGKYIYTLSSDFAPANYSFTAEVDDVLQPEISLDRSVYTVGVDREAVLSVEMNYDYPYVGQPEGGGEPTVTVSAELLDEVSSEDYTDPAWADSEMRCKAELTIPLEKVTAEVVEENEGTLPLKLTVKFNGIQKFGTTLAVPFEIPDARADTILTDGTATPAVRYYNVYGVEVDESWRGVVITSDGRKILR